MAGRHYGYYHFPSVAGDVFSLFGAIALLVLISSSTLYLPVKIWALSEEFLVAACTSAWLVNPWPAGDEQCSAKVGFKIGSIGLVVMAFAAWRLSVSLDTSNKKRRQEK